MISGLEMTCKKCKNKKFDIQKEKICSRPYNYEAQWAIIAKCRKCGEKYMLKSWWEYEY